MKKFTVVNWVYFVFVSSFFQLIFFSQFLYLLNLNVIGILLVFIDILIVYIIGCLLIKKWEISIGGIIITYPFRIIERKKTINYNDIIKINYIVVGKYSDNLKLSTTLGTYNVDIPNIIDGNYIVSFFVLMKEKNIQYIIKGGWKIYDENPPSREFLKQIEKEELIKKRNDLLKIMKKSKQHPLNRT